LFDLGLLDPKRLHECARLFKTAVHDEFQLYFAWRNMDSRYLDSRYLDSRNMDRHTWDVDGRCLEHGHHQVGPQ
jgi:hypothetical protein